MPTYATAADCLDYTPGLVIDDAVAFGRLIEQAERDVDALLGPQPPRHDTGLKLDPETNLLPWARKALARATAAQVEWLLVTKREEWLGVGTAPVTSVKGPDFEQQFAVSLTRAGLPPTQLAPRVARELEPMRRLLKVSVRGRP